MQILAPSLLLYVALALNAVPLAHAVRFPVEARMGGFAPHGHTRRASITGTPDITNQGNMQYQTNVTLNGQQFPVLVDTGSSDLYVVGTVNGASDTGKTGQVTYALGNTKGPVKTAVVDFEGFTVHDQAFIEQPADAQHPAGSAGVIGLGPSEASNIDEMFSNGAGLPILDRIFRQNTSTPNYITVLLGRAGDPTDTFVGDFTIGEVVSPFENITSQPKLPVTQMKNMNGQHWTAMLDKNGIIGPDGLRMNTTKHATGNKLTVMFDTGFTFPQVSKNIANQIYGRVPGAVFTNVTGGSAPMWTLPCSTELNVSFIFSNVTFPIHPLDTVTSALQGPLDDTGAPTCVGAFQPITTNIDGFDIILGMSFLRNAYMLINFGDFVEGALAKVGDPYIQLLSLTEPAEAHADFVQVRTGGIDRSADLHLLPALPSTGEDGKDDSDKDEDTIHKYLPYIIAGSAVAGVIILGLIISVAYRASSKRKYRRLHDPAPAGLPTFKPPRY